MVRLPFVEIHKMAVIGRLEIVRLPFRESAIGCYWEVRYSQIAL